MKILVLSHSSELAGAELSLIDLFDYWTRQKQVQPHFVIRKPLRSMAKELEHRNWDYTALYYNGWASRVPYEKRRAEDIYRNALFNSKATFRIEKLIKETNPDVVMTNTIISPWAAFAAHFQGVPHVWFVREYGDLDNRHNFESGLEGMFKDIDRLSALVVTNSKTLAKHIGKYMDKNEPVPLYNPFDLNQLESKSAKTTKNPFINQGSLKIVITGRIAPSKGQADAAEAVGRLARQEHDVELCIIGKPSEPADEETLRRTIEKYKIGDRVHLVGQQSNPLAIVKHADLGIMASRGEAFGRVTFEYMSLGLPVIGARSGATPELIKDGNQGFLYKEGDVKSLTKALLKYINNPKLISKHSKSAQSKTKAMMDSEYNADAVLARIQALAKNREEHITPPINHTHRWLEYPGVSAEYIKDSGVISIPRLIYRRARHKAKWIYLTVIRSVRFVGRGFRRSQK